MLRVRVSVTCIGFGTLGSTFRRFVGGPSSPVTVSGSAFFFWFPGTRIFFGRPRPLLAGGAYSSTLIATSSPGVGEGVRWGGVGVRRGGGGGGGEGVRRGGGGGGEGVRRGGGGDGEGVWRGGGEGRRAASSSSKLIVSVGDISALLRNLNGSSASSDEVFARCRARLYVSPTDNEVGN